MAKEEFDVLPEGSTLIGDTEEFDTLPEGSELIQDEPKQKGFDIAGPIGGVAEKTKQLFSSKQEFDTLPEGSVLIEDSPQDEPVTQDTPGAVQMPNGSFGVPIDKMPDIRPDVKSQPQRLAAVKLESDMNPYVRSFISGLSQVNSNLARIPAFAYDTLAMPQNIVEKVTGWKVGTKSPEWLINNPIAKYYDKASEAFNYKAKAFQGEDLLSLAEKKDYGRAGEYLAHSVIENIPNQMMLVLGSLSGAGELQVLGTMGAMQGAGKNKEARDKGLEPLKATTAAIVSGGYEAIFERAGTFGLLKEAQEIFKTMGKATGKEILKATLRSVLHTAIGEGNEEFWTSIAQDFSDKVYGVNDIPFREFFPRAIEAGTVGALSGGLMTSPAGVSSGLAISAQQKQMNDASELLEASKNLKLRSGQATEEPVKDAVGAEIPGSEAVEAPEGFRFKSTEEAVAYGKEIGGDEAKIQELQSERQATIQAAAQEKDINAKYLAMKKAQLLRDAIDEAKKTRPMKVEAAPVEEGLGETLIGKKAVNKQGKEVAVVSVERDEDTRKGSQIYKVTLSDGTHFSRNGGKQSDGSFINLDDEWLAFSLKTPLIRLDDESNVYTLKNEATPEKQLTPKVNKTSPKKKRASKPRKISKTIYTFPEGIITEEDAKKILPGYKEGDDPVALVVREMRQEIAEGQAGFKFVNAPDQAGANGMDTVVAGYEPSTFPDYFKNKGYTKDESIKVIDYYLNGKPMTEKQKTLLTELFYAKIEHAKQEAEKYAEDERRAKEEIAASGVSSDEIEKETSDARASEEGSSDEADQRLRAAIIGIEGLISPEGNITRGTDFIRDTYLADLDQESLGALQIWASRHMNPQIRRIIGDEISAILRSDEESKAPQEGDQTLIPGTEKPTFKKPEFGAPKTLKEQDESALPLQQSANDDQQVGLFDAQEKIPTLDEYIESRRKGSEVVYRKELTAEYEAKYGRQEKESPKVVQDIGSIQANDGKIDDVGEKIGGARKDTAKSTGPKTKRLNPELPGWRNRYVVAEGVYEQNKGKFTILDKRVKGRWGGNKSVGGWFDTREEAEAAIPLAAVARNHRVYQVSEGKFEIWRDISDRKRVKVLDMVFDSREEGMKYMAQNAEAIINVQTSFGEEILPRPDKVQRTGADYRKGRDVAAEDFRQAFSFRAVEFGLWNNQEERQEVMNHAYDGLMDLAAICKVPPTAIGLNGELSLAFGARGQGLTGARAHYERDYGVINLTKMAGAGALAHEWFHATDHYFARLDTKAKAAKTDAEKGKPIYDPQGPERDYASHGFSRKDSKVRPEVRAAYEKLMKTMFFKAVQYKEDTQKADKFVGEAREDLKRELGKIRDYLAKEQDPRYYKKKAKPATAKQLAKFDEMANKLIAGEMLSTTFKASDNKNAKAWSGRYTNDALEAMSAIYKEVRGRSGFSSGQGTFDNLRSYMTRYDARLKMLAEAQAGTEKEKQVLTEYAMEAKSIDQGRASQYWTTEHEMAARAFSAYVDDKIKEQGNSSDFIVYQTNVAIETPWGWKRPYPKGEERKAINAAFDELFGMLKTDDAGKMFYQEAEADLYSLAHFVAERKVANNANPGQVLATLKNNGVKQEEIEWMGLEQFLAGKDRVSKPELLEFIRQNQVNVKETVLGENKYAEKIEELKRRGEWLQGQRDEIIDHSMGNDLSIHLEKRLADLRAESDIVNEEIERLESQSGGAARWDTSNYVTPGLTNKREIVLSVPGIEPFEVNDTNHYGDIEKGTAIVWIRAGDSVIDGKKTLMIDEIQSKRHQKGREKGYQGEAVKYGDRIEGYTPVGHEWKKTTRPDKNYVIHQLVNSATGNVVAEGQVKSEILKKSGLGNGVPNAPFKKTWHELALKKILRMAVEGGYDAIAWTTGEQQAERYDLSKQVDRIEYELYGKDNATVTIEKNGNVLEQMEHANREEVTKMLGKEIAEKIFNDKGTSIADGVSELAGLDLKVGGEGMKGFYDQIIPQFLNKYTKKWGGRVVEGKIETAPAPYPTEDSPMNRPVKVHSLEITPSMRDSVLAGQPMFQTQATAKASSFEAEAAKLKEILEIHGIESVTIELANKIITPRGTKAFGAYDAAAEKARLVSVPKKTTGYHEGFHIVLRKAFTEDRIQDVLDSVKNDEIETDSQAEEYLAERFAKYANKRNSAGLSDKVVAFFEDLLYFIKRMIGFSSKTENLFNEMLHPDYYVPSAPVEHASVFYQENDEPEVNAERRNWKLSDRSKAIIQKYAERVGEGYVPRGNLGVFYPGTKNIFVQALNDISTVVHEVTHYIDKKNRLAEKVIASTGRGDKVRKEITRIYVNLYGKGKPNHKLSKRITEGIAVLIENYAMNPEGVSSEYPDLVSLFIAPSGRYHVPAIAELIKDTQELLKDQRGIGALGRISARVTDKKHKVATSSYFGIWDRVKNLIKDDLWKLEKLEIIKGVPGEQSPSNWSRILRNVGSLVARNMQVGKGFWSWRNGDYAKVLDFNWGDLIQKTQGAGTSKVFGEWLVARRQYFMWKSLADAPKQLKELQDSLETADPEEQKEIEAEIQRFKAKIGKTGELLEKDKFNRQDVEDVYAMFSEDFKDEAAMFDALVRADLEMLADPEVMLLTREQKDEMMAREGYATYHRDVYNDILGDAQPFSTSRVAAQRASFMKERVGSELDVLNPLYGQLLNHAEALKKSLRQTVYNKLLKLGEKVPELFQRQSLIAIPQSDGSIHFPQMTDPDIFMARENYKKVPVLISREIKSLLDAALNPKNIDAFEKVLLATKRFFTVGTTSAYPPFAIKNFARDQVTAWFLSKNEKFRPFYDSINSLRQALINTETEEAKLAEEYFALGGERQTMAGMFEKEPGEVLEMVAREVNGIRSVSEKIEKGAESVISVLSIPAKYSEYATRLAEYILSRKAGKSQVEAMEDAGRVSGSFHHFGSFGGNQLLASLWRTIPFANPRLQVFMQMIDKAMDKDPKSRAKAWTVLATMTALSVSGFASVLMFGDDDDKEQYKNIKPQMLGSYIYIPNPAGKGLITFPIPNELGVLGAAVNSVIANYVLDARYTSAEFLDIASSVIPDQINVFDFTKMFASWLPQPISPAFGFVFNIKTFPEVGPIDRYPKFAGNEKYRRSSNAAIALGKLTNTSPMKIDYLIQGYLSRSMRFIPGFGPSDKGWLATVIDQFQNGILSSYYMSSGRNVREYNEIKDQTQTDWSSYINKERDFTPEEISKLKWNRRILLKDKFSGTMGLNQLVQLYRDLADGDVSKDTPQARKIREQIIYRIARLKR